MGKINIHTNYNLPHYFNRKQLNVISDVLQRPSIYCIQGPPGTGKTAVLASIASSFAGMHKDVLVISNTHQAVNNALDKIASCNIEANIVKIGEALKAKKICSKILISETYNDYLKVRKKRSKKFSNLGDIVGMTLHAAVINIGLRNSGFQPQIVLIDEAGQIPMPYASVIGSFGCGSIIFIGDDKQMPPIFHPDLTTHKFSQSIFSYICDKYPKLRNTLNVTYRMNKDITSYVNERYYGSINPSQELIASDYSKNRKFPYFINKKHSTRINELLNPDQSITYCVVETLQPCTDSNMAEAEIVQKLVKACIDEGMPPSDVAVITPFRKQVKTLRACFQSKNWDLKEMPIINTIECLQGQDVECIIISFSVSDDEYLKQHYEFIMDPHRINVMVSRAKTKVVFVLSASIRKLVPFL